MALCESQLDSVRQIKTDEQTADKKMEPNGDMYGLDKVPPLPLSVDYRSPVSHFVPPAVELYAARHKPEINVAPATSQTPPPMKRKRGRPRIDKTSPEYLANLAARKQAREMAAVMNNRVESGEKRKRGRPRVDKTSPEYLARKRARELEALEKKAKREYRRRTTGGKIVKTSSNMSSRVKKAPTNKVTMRKTSQKVSVRKSDKKIIMRRNAKFLKRKDSAASSSAGESTPRAKRKYTKRAPNKKDSTPNAERVKGKRGRPRKSDQLANKQPQQGKIRVRSNLMPSTTEPISLDSDDEPDLGSPSQASDSLSLDENLRALRHIHEKYANIDKDDLYEAHLLAANFKKPSDQMDQTERDDDVLSVRSSEGASVKELNTRTEKLEDSSNSDSDSSSGSGSSSSSSSSSSGSSSSSDSSDSDSDDDKKNNDKPKDDKNDKNKTVNSVEDDRSFGSWSHHRSESATGSNTDTDTDSDPERVVMGVPPAQDDISESDNESSDKSFQCHVCRKWYSTRVTLKIHRRVHQNKGGGTSRSRTRSSDRYECDCCNETFNRREKLWEHKAEVHRGSMTVRCEVCRKCFEDDAELAAHDRTHTADERAGRCAECGSTFARFEQLRRHMQHAHAHAHAARLPHACAQCGKRFSHAHSLTRHMHNHAKQLYRCVVCKASFARADQLAQHLNSHLANYKRLKQ